MGCPGLGQLWVPLKIQTSGACGRAPGPENRRKAPPWPRLSCSLKGSWHQRPAHRRFRNQPISPSSVPGMPQGVGNVRELVG